MKVIKRILKAIGIILTIFIVMNGSYIYRQMSILFSKLPDKYKDYSYTGRLDSLLLHSNLKVKIFKSLYQEQIVTLNDSTRYMRINQLDSTTVSWYKINSNGKIIDSLHFYNDEHVEDVDFYLISPKKEYYLTWLRDGDTIKKPVKILNNKIIKNNDTFKNYFSDVAYTNIEYVNDRNSEERIKKVIFYKDATFYKCYTTENAWVPYENFYHFDNTIKYNSFGNVVFYERTDWRAATWPDFSLYLNGKRPDHWYGYTYIDFTILGETFKIKDYRKAYEDYDTTKMYGIDLYENPNKKYYLLRELSHFENVYYLITK
ncbi:hypothetical protein [Tenacibaculum agarivorans]|uniref:hypothetical protein n=1 Tax=Tenacibaculum agarivorans TaxID=1908389 RepID=UPI000AC5ED3B|nr:hypothetical protein [Tenacibaculum agarivorans]